MSTLVETLHVLNITVDCDRKVKAAEMKDELMHILKQSKSSGVVA